MAKDKGECPCSESQTEAQNPVGRPMEISPDALELLRTPTVPFEFKEVVREVIPDMDPAPAETEAAALSPQIDVASIGAPAQEVIVTPWPERIPLDRGDETFYLTNLKLEVSGVAHMTPGLLELAACRVGQLMFCSDGDDEDEKAGNAEGEGKDDAGEQRLWYGVTIQNGRILTPPFKSPFPMPPPKVPKPGANVCVCTGASLNYNGKTHAPFLFPIEKTSPRPGLYDDDKRRKTGPVSGSLIPSLTPAEQSVGPYRIGNNFEYHSTLNGEHGCTSRQYQKEIRVEINKKSGVCEPLRIEDENGNKKDFVIDGSGFGPDADWQPDASGINAKESYKGTTYDEKIHDTGSSRGIIYKGTKNVIHWIDSPGWTIRPDDYADDIVLVWVMLLKSETTNSDGKHGWQCLSGHTFIFDGKTGRPMVAKNARTLLDRIVPAAGASADMQVIVSMLKTSPEEGGFQGNSNPEFRDLGCYPF